MYMFDTLQFSGFLEILHDEPFWSTSQFTWNYLRNTLWSVSCPSVVPHLPDNLTLAGPKGPPIYLSFVLKPSKAVYKSFTVMLLKQNCKVILMWNKPSSCFQQESFTPGSPLPVACGAPPFWAPGLRFDPCIHSLALFVEAHVQVALQWAWRDPLTVSMQDNVTNKIQGKPGEGVGDHDHQYQYQHLSSTACSHGLPAAAINGGHVIVET